jgi:hypothetical protein
VCRRLTAWQASGSAAACCPRCPPLLLTRRASLKRSPLLLLLLLLQPLWLRLWTWSCSCGAVLLWPAALQSLSA